MGQSQFQVNGLSASIFMNYAQRHNGLQLGRFNQSYYMNGFQVGGFNYSKKAKGVQIGEGTNAAAEISGVQL